LEKGILNAPMIKRNIVRFLILFTLAALTSGCLRPASSTAVDLTQFTSQPSPSAQNGITSDAPTVADALDAATQAALRTFPLWVGSTWVYDYLGYSQDEEAHWRVTDTVVSKDVLEGHYIVEIERQTELTLGNPGSEFSFSPRAGASYYLVDGTNVYQFESQVETDLDKAWLALVLPFPPDGESWIPDPVIRASGPSGEGGTRFADGPFDQVVAESGTRTCYNVVTTVTEGTDEATFCDGIGIVFWESDNGRGEGYRMELIGFVLQ